MAKQENVAPISCRISRETVNVLLNKRIELLGQAHRALYRAADGTIITVDDNQATSDPMMRIEDPRSVVGRDGRNAYVYTELFLHPFKRKVLIRSGAYFKNPDDTTQEWPARSSSKKRKLVACLSDWMTKRSKIEQDDQEREFFGVLEGFAQTKVQEVQNKFLAISKKEDRIDPYGRTSKEKLRDQQNNAIIRRLVESLWEDPDLQKTDGVKQCLLPGGKKVVYFIAEPEKKTQRTNNPLLYIYVYGTTELMPNLDRETPVNHFILRTSDNRLFHNKGKLVEHVKDGAIIRDHKLAPRGLLFNSLASQEQQEQLLQMFKAMQPFD